MPRKIKRGAIRKEDQTTFLGAYCPDQLVALVDLAVLQEDTDRSKFIRNALREKIARNGILAAA